MEKIEKDNSYSHILKYTGIFGGVQGLNILIGIVRNKCTALLLGPGGMGLVSLFNSTINMVVSTSSFGIPTSGVQEISNKYASQSNEVGESVKLIRSWCLLAAFIGMVLCVTFSPLLNRWAFTWGNHTLHFVLLSPVVALTVIVGGELAILKATRQLKSLAFTSLQVIVASLIVSVPVYYFWGQSGIIAVLLLQALVQLISAIRYSTRYYPYRVSCQPAYLHGGIHVVKLGIAFVLSGVINSGAEFLIRTYINNIGDLDEVGLFNAGNTLAIVYAGLVFSAMEADYFPRLSSIKARSAEQNECVNRQIDVNVLLVSPFLVLMIFCLPFLIPLLYDSSFSGMLRMAQFATVSMLFRAVYLPIEYLPLSKGQSVVFLFQEAFAVILMIGFEIVGYQTGGLTGIGAGVTLAYFIEMLAVIVYSKFFYSFRLTKQTISFMAMQILFVSLSLLLAMSGLQGIGYWAVAGICSLLNIGITLYIVKTKTAIFDFVLEKLKR